MNPSYYSYFSVNNSQSDTKYRHIVHVEKSKPASDKEIIPVEIEKTIRPKIADMEITVSSLLL